MAEYDMLPAVPGIDWQKAYENMPDMDLLFSVVNEFCVNTAKEMGELNGFFDSYFETGDDDAMENYRIKVHAMKNSVALIGAQELSDAAKALEYASRDREVDFVKTNNAAFVAQYENLSAVLADTFDIDTSKSTKAFDSASMKADLEALKAAFDEYEIETMNDIMDEIEKYEVGSSMEETIAKLSEAVLSLDEDLFGSAYDELMKYM